MRTIEEEIWDYIDGSCSENEKLLMEAKLANDDSYQTIYKELSAINQHLNNIDLDEPSMAFNKNVMNIIATEIAPVALKTKVDQRIIYSIGAFFMITLLSILIYAISQSHFSVPKLEMKINIDFQQYLTPALMKGFVFIDVLVGFLYFDKFLRRKNI